MARSGVLMRGSMSAGRVVFADPFVRRREQGQAHPVEDFLFTYYTLKPGQFKRWHPGGWCHPSGCRRTCQLEILPCGNRRRARLSRALPDDAHTHAERGDAVLVDVPQFVDKRGTALTFTREILGNTADKKAFFGCFGMHEWAMAYKSVQNNIRHDYLDLRLGAEGTDRVVESHRIRCSHFDAFRFFMPQAAPMNELQPTRETQRFMEQPACLHANMDIYKWAYKLIPLIDSALVMDCFELAWDARELDMCAAPYDLLDWGYEPIKVETPEGKASMCSINASCRNVQWRCGDVC